MERDEYADMFRFRIGQAVRWAEYPDERYRIGQRRWAQREILAPIVAYRLRRGHEGRGELGGLGGGGSELGLEGPEKGRGAAAAARGREGRKRQEGQESWRGR